MYAHADKSISPVLRERMLETNAIAADPSGKGLHRIRALFSSFWEQAFNSFAAYDVFYQKNRRHLFDIRARLELAVESGNEVEILRSFQNLLNLYFQNNHLVPQDLAERISAARQIVDSPPGENFEKLRQIADEFTPEPLVATAKEAYGWMQAKSNSPFPTKPNALVDITTTQAAIIGTNFIGSFTSLIAFGRLKIDILGYQIDLPKAFAESPFVTGFEMLGVSALMLVSLGAVYKALEKGQSLVGWSFQSTHRILQKLREDWERSHPDLQAAGGVATGRESLGKRILSSCRRSRTLR